MEKNLEKYRFLQSSKNINQMKGIAIYPAQENLSWLYFSPLTYPTSVQYSACVRICLVPHSRWVQ